MGHHFKSCDSFKKCYYCKRAGHHYRCIYPQKFLISTEDSTVSQSFTTNTDHQDREDNQSSSTPESDTSLAISTRVDNLAGDSDHMLLASGEKVLLQTAIVLVCCSDRSVITARVLLDSASQRTFMTN